MTEQQRPSEVRSPASADGASNRHRATDVGKAGLNNLFTSDDGTYDPHDLFLRELHGRAYVESVQELSREGLEKQVGLLQRYASLLEETRNRQIKELEHNYRQLERRYEAKIESFEKTLKDERTLSYQLGQTCQDVKEDKERLMEEMKQHESRVAEIQKEKQQELEATKENLEKEKEQIRQEYQQEVDSQREQIDRICIECENLESKLTTLHETLQTSGSHPQQALSILYQGRCDRRNQCVIQEEIPSQIELKEKELSYYQQLVQQKNEEISSLEKVRADSSQQQEPSESTAVVDHHVQLEIQRPHTPDLLLDSSDANNEGFANLQASINVDSKEVVPQSRETQLVQETEELRSKLLESEQLREQKSQELKATESNVEKLRKEIRRLEKSLQNSQTEVRDVRRQYSALESKLHQEQRRIKLQEQHNERLNEQLETYKNYGEENRELRNNLKQEVSNKERLSKTLRKVLQQCYQIRDGTIHEGLQGAYKLIKKLRDEVVDLSKSLQQFQQEERHRITWYSIQVSRMNHSFSNQVEALVAKLCARNRPEPDASPTEDAGIRKTESYPLSRLQHAVAIHQQHVQRYEDEQQGMISKQQQLQKRIDFLEYNIGKLKESWYIKRSENDALSRERDQLRERVHELQSENARLRGAPNDSKKRLKKNENMKQISLENENIELKENLQTLRDLYAEVVRDRTGDESWQNDLEEVHLETAKESRENSVAEATESVTEDLRDYSRLHYCLYMHQYDWKYASDLLEAIVTYCKDLANVASQGHDIRSLYGEVVFVIGEVESTYDYMCRRKVSPSQIEETREKGLFSLKRLLKKTGEWSRTSPLDDAISMFNESRFPVSESVHSITPQVFGLYREACEYNVTEAFFTLGRMYHFGEGVEKDTEEAAIWYEKAVEMNHAGAQNNLARLYESGDGVNQDMTKALELYRRATNEDYPAAQYNLATLYESGKSAEQDLAFDLFHKAARSSAEAQFKVGWMLDHGAGVPQNIDKAIWFYKESANQGLLNAQYNLAVLYEKSKADFDNAIKYYGMASAAGDRESRNALLRLSET